METERIAGQRFALSEDLHRLKSLASANDWASVTRIPRGGRGGGASLVTDRDLLRRLLVDNRAAFEKRVPFYHRLLSTPGLISISDEARQRRVKAYQGFFHEREVAVRAPAMSRAVHRRVERSSDRDVDRLVIESVAELSQSLLLGVTREAEDATERGAGVHRAIEELFAEVQGILAGPWLRVKFVVNPAYRARIRRRSRLVQDHISACIARAEARGEAGVGAGGLVDWVLWGPGAGQNDRREVQADLLQIYVASHESTYALALFLLTMLAGDRDAQGRLRAELRGAISQDELAAGVTYDRVAELRYLDAVVQEGLRLFPTIPYLTRTCVRSVEVGGVRFRRGDRLLFSPLLHGRNPRAWESPMEFRPERFLGNAGRGIGFGLGNRACLGRHLAALEVKLLLLHLLRDREVWRDEAVPVRVSVSSFVKPGDCGLALRAPKSASTDAVDASVEPSVRRG